MIVLFACRRYRVRDILLIRRGARPPGHRLLVLRMPLALPAVALFALLRPLGLRSHLVLSDKMIGDQWLARLFGRRATRMLWNYADEWPAAGTRLPPHKVCFFPEAGQAAEVGLFDFGPQPPAPALAPREFARAALFIGDVSTQCTLARGAEWWSARLEALCAAHGYDFYLHAEYEALIAAELPDARARRAARLYAKNLLRLWIVRDARQELGAALVLVGDNWRRHGLDSDPATYSQNARLAYFASARVNLDCGSKSGDCALYPRSSELMSFAGGILQLRCADSARVFGERVPEFCFRDRAGLAGLLAQRLSESAAARDERDAWLLARLGAQRLLMQHSLDGLLVR